MPADRTATVSTSPTQRSRVSNGSAVLPGVDGRSATVRRFRDILACIESDLGGYDAISEGERQLARRAAAMSVQAENLEARMAQGEDLAVDAYVRLVNGLNRTFASIGLQRRQRDATPRLADYLAEAASD